MNEAKPHPGLQIIIIVTIKREARGIYLVAKKMRSGRVGLLKISGGEVKDTSVVAE